MIVYHVSPPARRASIEAHGLEAEPRRRVPYSGQPGIFLWPSYAQARDFVHFSGFDIWEADLDPDTEILETANPLHPNEIWTGESIPPERIRLLT